VFKEWARSWARRRIIQNAIQMIHPQREDDSVQSDTSHAGTHATSQERPEIAAIIALPAFERFVFVMSVLERYSDQECSLLLGCTRADVLAARARALQQIAKSAELQDSVEGIDSPGNLDSKVGSPASSKTASQFGSLSPLAVSA
jgi:DNA-directed RNA polymerase specialized sigma24 family protein